LIPVPEPVAPAAGGPRCYVSTPVFEGPFDLLLHLILREQVDIYELSLSGVVDAYLAELERLPAIDLEVATEFLVIAATLVELKSRRLLPVPAEPDVEDEGLWEERDLLLARLLECKTFKDAARALQAREDAAGRSLPRPGGSDDPRLTVGPDLLAGITAGDLRAAFLRVTRPAPVRRVDLDHVAPIRVSVREAVDELLEQLPMTRHMTFRRLTRGLEGRLEVIVRFLAVLELYREGLVELQQGRTFGRIEIWWRGRGLDRHGLVAEAGSYDG
jgi:segregation and condensation protein A